MAPEGEPPRGPGPMWTCVEYTLFCQVGCNSTVMLTVWREWQEEICFLMRDFVYIFITDCWAANHLLCPVTMIQFQPCLLPKLPALN